MFKISLYLRSSSVIGTSAMPIPRIHVIDNKIPVIIRTGCGNCLYFIGHRTAKYRSILNIILYIHINYSKYYSLSLHILQQKYAEANCLWVRAIMHSMGRSSRWQPTTTSTSLSRTGKIPYLL